MAIAARWLRAARSPQPSEQSSSPCRRTSGSPAPSHVRTVRRRPPGMWTEETRGSRMTLWPCYRQVGHPILRGAGARTPARREASIGAAARRREPWPMPPTTSPKNLAARMGRWSAAHRKTAIFGWLAFVLVAVVLGGAAGTKTLEDGQDGTGSSGRADVVL